MGKLYVWTTMAYLIVFSFGDFEIKAISTCAAGLLILAISYLDTLTDPQLAH